MTMIDREGVGAEPISSSPKKFLTRVLERVKDKRRPKRELTPNPESAFDPDPIFKRIKSLLRLRDNDTGKLLIESDRKFFDELIKNVFLLEPLFSNVDNRFTYDLLSLVNEFLFFSTDFEEIYKQVEQQLVGFFEKNVPKILDNPSFITDNEALNRLHISGIAQIMETLGSRKASYPKITTRVQDWTHTHQTDLNTLPEKEMLVPLLGFLREKGTQNDLGLIDKIRAFLEGETDDSLIKILAKMCASEDVEINTIAEMLLREFLSQKFAIEGQFLIDSWKRNKVGEHSKINLAILKNYEVMATLFKEDKKIVPTLFDEFRIKNFGRYPAELLIRQFKKRNEQGRYGVVVFPDADHNGGFFQDGQTLEQLRTKLPDDIELRIFEADSAVNLFRILLRCKRRYVMHKIEFGILGGHGGSREVGLGHQQRLLQKQLRDLGIRSRGHLKQCFVPNPKIILISCDTGSETDEDGNPDLPIAADISQVLDATVAAPNGVSAGAEEIDVEQIDGDLNFEVTYGGVPTAKFEKGKRV